MKKLSLLFIALLLGVGLTSCGGAGLVTTQGPIQEGQVSLNVFSLGTLYPSDIQIPDMDGMRDTAFVVSDSPALGVIPVNLDTLTAFQGFQGLDASSNEIASVVQYSRRVQILSPTQALYLGGGGLVYFNPSSGEIYGDPVSLTTAINLDEELSFSRPGDLNFDGINEDSVTGAFSPSFASTLTVFGDQVFVTMSNLAFDGNAENPVFFVQGLVLIFTLHDSAPYLQPASTPYIVTSGFNPSGLTVHQGKIYVTNSGATARTEGKQVPLTDSILDKVDPEILQITNSMSLGKIAANEKPLAILDDGRTAFIGSAAYSHVYEIDLEDLSVTRGLDNPIVISDKESDYITDQVLNQDQTKLFISSFNNEFVRSVDLSSEERTLDEIVWNFHIPPTPGLTGAGPMALRPGVGGVDFIGNDLFVLTGDPGTLSAIKTY